MSKAVRSPRSNSRGMGLETVTGLCARGGEVSWGMGWRETGKGRGRDGMGEEALQSLGFVGVNG